MREAQVSTPVNTLAWLGLARLLNVNTAFLSGQARSHLCLAYVVGLNFLTYGVPRKLVRLIKMCLIGTYNRVRVGKNLSDMFPIGNGLKHGDALSPLPFNFALGWAIGSV